MKTELVRMKAVKKMRRRWKQRRRVSTFLPNSPPFLMVRTNCKGQTGPNWAFIRLIVLNILSRHMSITLWTYTSLREQYLHSYTESRGQWDNCFSSLAIQKIKNLFANLVFIPIALQTFKNSWDGVIFSSLKWRKTALPQFFLGGGISSRAVHQSHWYSNAINNCPVGFQTTVRWKRESRDSWREPRSGPCPPPW